MEYLGSCRGSRSPKLALAFVFERDRHLRENLAAGTWVLELL
jgi:hypothetical protein